MRTNRCSLLFGVLGLLILVSFSFGGQPEMSSLERLVYLRSPAFNDTPSHSDSLQATASNFERELGKIPDVNDRLLWLVERDFNQVPDPQKLGFSMFALSCRNDLTAAQIERLKAVESTFGKVGSRNQLEEQFICGFLGVLAKYPTRANEDIAIKYAVSNNVIEVLYAFGALARIGTSRSVNVAGDAIQRRRELVRGRYDYWLKVMEESYQALLTRVQATPEASANTTTPDSLLNAGPHLQIISSPKEDPKIASKFDALPWLAGALATITLGIIVHFRKNRKTFTSASPARPR